MRPKKNEREKLISVTVRLTLDQVNFLRSLDNASEFIRKAIDHEKELALNPLESERLRLIQQINALETQISELTNHETYRKAKRELKESERVLRIYAGEEDQGKEETRELDKRYYTAVVKSFEEKIKKLEEEKQKLKERLVTET